MIYTATCLFGLEAALGAEIEALGYRRTETMDGRVTFEGGAYAAARCSVFMRYAERLYLDLGSFEAATFDGVFEAVRALPLEDVIGKSDAFPVKGHSIKSRLFSVPDLQRIIKKAAATRLGSAYGLSVMPETGTKYQLEFFLFKDRMTLMIDLSGEGLHKRGYRPERVTAPLRETLAAECVRISRPREDVLLRDPFCGSGTIAIEAAMMMKNKAPGAARRHAAEDFPVFPAESWRHAREEAAGSEKKTAFRAFASDIDPECVRIARESARRAGVDDMIDFSVMDARDIETGGVRGTVVTNPPYGERLMTVKDAEALYRDIGRSFSSLGKWQMYILTSHERFPDFFGRRADKIKKLYNGMIPCYLYEYFKN